ncbi:hypothetical protein C7387_2285 [Yokenella regensburgei]|jgi:hypothetical protein|uniref:DNA transfer protein n=1 Tax=Yokenella regensburgei TaxID=158877 RepID=A0ABX9S4C9_9ENTR|nr:DNA transfer protein [Yokenella regensburgei]RKR65540.1 hypothetical protein C7387_2285 [Yokenella regensburgei]VFS16026.1 Uncharacterised protein [Yokenella regensburgei]
MLIFQIANKHLSKAVYQKGGGDNGAGAQAEATQKGIDLQREMWQTNMNNLAPFTPLAQQYIQQLQGLSTPQGQQSALNDYYGSQQYKDMAGQLRYQALNSAEATGGLGSTATTNSLATIAPTLGQNWLSGQMNNYQNLANIGLGALTGQATAGQNYANNVGQLYQQQANASAANANQPSTGQKMLGGAASGAAMGTAIMPGWGTAIGAGVGALGSLLF